MAYEDGYFRIGRLLACLIVGAAALGGCSLISAPRASTTFDLEAPSSARKRAGGAGVIVVPEPTALRSLDSDKIAVKPTKTVINYYPDSQWSDRLPRLVQARTIQAFENASRLASIGRPSDGLTPDFQLVMDIRSFELETNPTPTGVVEITAKLVSLQAGRAPSARVFAARVVATDDKVDNAVAALDAALAQALTEMIAWAATNT